MFFDISLIHTTETLDIEKAARHTTKFLIQLLYGAKSSDTGVAAIIVAIKILVESGKRRGYKGGSHSCNGYKISY
jgi:hypothetical protein